MANRMAERQEASREGVAGLFVIVFSFKFQGFIGYKDSDAFRSLFKS